jgi:hypothetical protein
MPVDWNNDCEIGARFRRRCDWIVVNAREVGTELREDIDRDNQYWNEQ